MIGVIVGALFGIRGAAEAQLPLVHCVVGGMLVGGVAGFLVLVLDPAPPSEAPVALPEPLATWHAPASTSSGLVGRFLAVAGLLLCWAPGIGLVLNLIALSVNWKATDWAHTLSKVNVAVTLLVGIVLATAFFVEAFNG